MRKKLIFLREGLREYYDYSVNIDVYIQSFGFLETVKLITKIECKWFISACPTILNVTDGQGNPIWWNEEEHKWDIYFVEDDGLHNIQEYTGKELRQAHNIERLYLNGGFDEHR